MGSVLDGAELVLIVPVLEAGPRLAAYGRTIREMAPGVATIAAGLPQLSELRTRLERALDEEGGVRDQASATLGTVRRELRNRRRRLVQDLERMLAQSDADRIFADRFVTVRHDRYVVPVRAEARARVRGIVHDRSQSGQTVFVEPEAFVEANNDLVQLARDESAEVARIVAELTDAVRDCLDEIEALVDGIGLLDWIVARADAAERMEATAPLVARGNRVDVHQARHPLLIAQSWRDRSREVVPVDLELAQDRPLLLITGPNAGGKTVALKTLGLLVLMAQSGCHVPAADGARLPVFESIHAIIGDDQSVSENLSTFSAFVAQVREVLADAGPASLVLLDELGAGTDPDEGAALARAILETLADAGAFVVASTHLEPLKVFAGSDPRARNASVEFDADKLAPTFRLRYDHPGQSYALAIAGRLGLPPALIARADTHRSSDAARLADLIKRLDEDTRRDEQRSRAIEAHEAETAARLEAARRAEAAADARARKTIEDARAEAHALLGDVRRAVNTEWERLRRTERSRHTLEESRGRLRQISAKLPDAPLPPPEPGVTLVPGMAVKAHHLGLAGEIITISGATATVRSGTVTVRVPLAALRPSEPPDASLSERRARPAVRTPDKHDVQPELHLLGRTTDEARDLVEQYLDDAFLAGMPAVRLVHGKGTGALRKAVRELLATHPLVDSFRDGEPSEGGSGATIAQLKVS